MPLTPALSKRIVVFSRYPEPGSAKTRLIPALGPPRAAHLQDRLTTGTLETVEAFQRACRCELEVRFAGGDPTLMAARFGQRFSYRPQCEGDLGARLSEAVAEAFQNRVDRLLVLGTDSPEITPSTLDQAFQQLERHDVVIGPAHDGGYYLIGLRCFQPALFRDIPWGSDRVLACTMAAARRCKARVAQLEPLSDIDHPEDLIVCRRLEGRFGDVLPVSQPGRLSVIVPTLNEAANVGKTLRSMEGDRDVEWIVADAGSVDGTVDEVRKAGAKLVVTRPGRGRQMNAGAALASGETLLFLHADTQLPPDFSALIASARNSGAIAGSFTLRIDDRRRSLRLIERAASLRTRLFQLPYGDQGIFVSAAVFYQLGGFRLWPLMEDFEFCRRLRQRGRIVQLPAMVTASARRWQRLGVWRTTALNQACIAGYLLGVSPDRLADWYRTGWGRRAR